MLSETRRLFNMKLNYHCSLTLAIAVTLASSSATLKADDLADLRKEVQALREEVATLKAARSTSSPSGTNSTVGMPEIESTDSGLLGKDFFRGKGLTIGFYGESKYRLPEAGAASFDAHRYVLTPGFQIADWLVFNSELELEHGGVDESTGRGSRFNGELEVEQFYVDILLHEHFNIRSLGIDLVPVGRINTTHEPTTFYSTERPELYREIIPSTWMEPSVGIFGKITDTLDYRLQISTGLEDFSSSAGGAGVTAVNGMRNARPRMRAADESNLAYSGRLHYNGIKGLDTSASFYVSSAKGTNSEDVTLALFDVEALYRVPGTGLELRGDFAYWFIDNPRDLIANNTGPANDDIGDNMYGWYVEAAYHFWPEAWRSGRGAEMDFVPFVRYSQIRTQSGLQPGSAELTNGTANRDFVTFGAAWFLTPRFVVKGDWRRNLNHSSVTRTSAASQNYFQMGVGMAF
jgi:hypothetical protein